MTNDKKGLQDAVISAKEVLEKTDKEKYPKLYESREANVKSLEIALDQRLRAKKAEKDLKNNPPEEKKTPKNNGDATPTKRFSLDDIEEMSALSKVHKDDREEIFDYAERKKLKVSEVLDKPFIASFLKEKEEERKSAEASNTAKNQRTTSKSSNKRLLDQLEKGELPEEDIDKAVKARFKKLKGKS
uniref:Uncharacterized protein n=1 Tax=viral metagenome TaxID=1070528 RepID=A0A6H1ZS94_9ZZZZ